MNNPLLAPSALPPFARIRPEHIEPAIRAILADNRAALARLLEEELVAPVEGLEAEFRAGLLLLRDRLARQRTRAQREAESPPRTLDDPSLPPAAHPDGPG
jgi:hypothetical protein